MLLPAMSQEGGSRVERAPGVVRGEWWRRRDDGRLQCELCPRYCRLHEGQRAFCYVRQARDGEIVLASYSRVSGFCIKPIEKKPLNHFHPGLAVLSFGTAGCNLGCRFCQNWDMSKAREDDVLSSAAAPAMVAEAAVNGGCDTMAFTYNDPIIFAEYAIDCAVAAHERDVRTVAVTSGYITPEARPPFFRHIDAANVDMKAFTDDFYRSVCFAELGPVLDTIRWLTNETEVWAELTTLLIPGHNDSEDEVARLCDWVAEEAGPEVPLYFTALHPGFKLTDAPPTPPDTLRRARRQGLGAGLRHVYTGNIHDPEGQSTSCVGCGCSVIARDRYQIKAWALDESGHCTVCGMALDGHVQGQPGTWGGRRQRVSVGGRPGPA